MNQHGAVAKQITFVQGLAVRACELRLERHARDVSGKEQVEYICGASGVSEHGHVLGVVGEMSAICNTCPIPDALETRQSCLNLVPVRRFSGGKRILPMAQPHAQADQIDEPTAVYFPCRWFYTLYGHNQPRDTSVCRSCQHWFPRPPRELIPDYWPETQKMLRVVNGEESASGPPIGFTPAPRHLPARTWWQRILQKVHP